MTLEKSRRANQLIGRALLLFVMGVASGRAALDLWVDHRLTTIFRTLEREGLQTCPRQLESTPLPPDENAAPLYTAAFAVAVEMTSFFDAESREPELDVLLARNAKAFELIRLARTMKACRFKRDLSCNRFEIDVPESGGVLAACAALDYKARREAEQGRHEAARDTVRDMLGLSNAYRDEPIHQSQYRRRSIVERAARTVAWCSRHANTTEDLVAWLDLVPDPCTLDGSAALGIRGDLACGACRLAQPNPFVLLKVGDDWATATFGRFLSPLVRACSMDSFGQYAESADRLSVSDPEAFRRTPWDIGTLFAFSPTRALKDQRFAQTVLAVTRAGLKAEIRGCDPESIEEMDPFTGKPLSYDSEQGTISSAGPPDQSADMLEGDGLLWRLRAR